MDGAVHTMTLGDWKEELWIDWGKLKLKEVRQPSMFLDSFRDVFSSTPKYLGHMWQMDLLGGPSSSFAALKCMYKYPCK